MQDIIFIKDIPVQTIIGIHDFEQVAPQKLLVSVELGTDIRQAAQTDDVQYALDYAAISQLLVDTIEASRFALLEALAEHIVETLFAHFAMHSIKLTLSKPSAIPYTQQVGLSIYRERQ